MKICVAIEIINKTVSEKANIKKESSELPWWLSGKESTCQCRRHRFDPWSGEIPHATEQLSPWAATTEPVLTSPGAGTSEARAPRSLRTRAPWGACVSPLESGLHSPQLGERARSEEDPEQPESELNRLKESRKFSPKLTHQQPNSVSSENYEAQNTFRKAQETAPRIWTRGKSQSRGSECKRGTWILFQFPTTVSL